VLVARDGSNPTAWNNNLKRSPSLSNSSSVVGRYAYAIYDEGGLLDMNVAGYSSSALAGSSSQDVSRKGALAFADLTQLPVTSGALSKADADKIVNWRNAATCSTYVNSVLTNPTGFTAVNGTNGLTDQVFVSRQSLIQFITSGTLSLNTADAQSLLQYMGTFSRGLCQPSYSPDPNRPTIQSPGSTSGGTWNPTTYQGGNDVYGEDNVVNPKFLSVRVQNSFTRNDGSSAIVGEPLVKKRFDLRRLAWITYQGPSSGRSGPDITQTLSSGSAIGITSEFLAQGTAANIQNYFGLVWSGSYWTYNKLVSGSIGTLTDVQTLNREPNFFELLKAGINAGSVGKACASGTGGQDAGAYQHNLDISVDQQIIQIGANIIDQSSAAGYPIEIVYASRSIFGEETIPYMYRSTASWVLKRKPNPLLGSGTYSQVVPGASSLLDAGEIDLLLVPHVWNPYDQYDIQARGTNFALGTPRPSSFRILASSNIPGSSPYGLAPLTTFIVQSNTTTSAKTFAALSGTMNFSDPNGGLFREPTMLWKSGYPAGSGLSPTSGSGILSALDSTQTFLGFVSGMAPAEKYWSISGTNYILQASSISCDYEPIAGSPTGYLGAMTYQMEYQDSAGNWIPYDVKCWDSQKALTCMVNINSTDPRNSGAFGWQTPLGYPSATSTNEFNSIVADPRTARWGGATSSQGIGMPATIWDFPTGNVNFSVVMTNRPGMGGNQANGCEIAHTSQTEPAGAIGAGMPQIMFYDTQLYSNGAANPLVWGMFTQNNPYAPCGVNNAHKQFNADADGVVRRAMAAYVPVASNSAASGTIGLPMAQATTFDASGNGTPNASQSQSRPIILHRPFHTVDELGYAFKGTPFKNIDFFTPESGDAALLDIFCVNDGSNPGALVAGKVNLNTRQKPVLQAVLAGAIFDELALSSTLSVTETQKIAGALIARTTGLNAWQGPLVNVGDLVGRFVGKNVSGINITSGSAQTGMGNQGNNYYACHYETPGSLWGASGNTVCYSGLSADLDATVFDASHASAAPYIQRLRQSVIRPLASCGQTRVWNLMIDLVAQTGIYPESATGPSDFLVEGEKRYWLHVAIDRATGQVIDRQLETVNE
jgi:hypothetical protein